MAKYGIWKDIDHVEGNIYEKIQITLKAFCFSIIKISKTFVIVLVNNNNTYSFGFEFLCKIISFSKTNNYLSIMA